MKLPFEQAYNPPQNAWGHISTLDSFCRPFVTKSCKLLESCKLLRSCEPTICGLIHTLTLGKKESKETMVLKVVTDGKNDKTEKNGKEYVHNKRTQDGTCVLFCVPPSFVLIDNKYILSCAGTGSK